LACVDAHQNLIVELSVEPVDAASRHEEVKA